MCQLIHLIPIKYILIPLAMLFFSCPISADSDFPQVELSNGILNARVYLPDVEHGYYRGGRFDWSGVISSLTYGGHEYYGEWFDSHDPTQHDGIVGPVEEFGPLGFRQAAVGDEFVKIGIGGLLKPDGQPYAFHKSYVLSNPGVWSVQNDAKSVSFTHKLEDTEYPYEYNKVVRLADGEARLTLTHALRNTGDKVIMTQVYNHNFFVIDGEATGPGYRVTLPGEHLSTHGAKGLGDIVELANNELVFLRGLRRGEQAYFPDLGGGQPVPYQITVENVRSGAGVKISGDQPITKMVFWSSPSTVCPEPYISIHVEPGETFRWSITYEYYH